MSANLNRVLIAGNLTRDPEVKTVGSDGKSVAAFAIAINNRYRNAAGAMVEDVVFVDVEAWGKTAENVGKYLSKGRSVFVEGRLKLDRWETANGDKRQRLKVVADAVQFLDRGESRDPETAQASASKPAAPAGARTDDEPPF